MNYCLSLLVATSDVLLLHNLNFLILEQLLFSVLETVSIFVKNNAARDRSLALGSHRKFTFASSGAARWLIRLGCECAILIQLSSVAATLNFLHLRLLELSLFVKTFSG